MLNHFHLKMRSKDQPISKVMLQINKCYVDYYNTKKLAMDGLHLVEQIR